MGDILHPSYTKSGVFCPFFADLSSIKLTGRENFYSKTPRFLCKSIEKKECAGDNWQKAFNSGKISVFIEEKHRQHFQEKEVY